MKVESAIISRGSGSVGGFTWSHNRGGQYLRNHVTPTNPNTNLQATVRTLFGLLANLWQSTLTAAQRAAWDVYASNVAMLDKFGNTIYLTGFNHYIRSNTPLLQAGGTRIDDGPPIFSLGEFTPVVVTASEATQQASIAYSDGDDWVGEDDAYMLVYLSAPKQDTINFHKGPYRYAGKISGDSVTPPASPQTVALPIEAVAGQKVFARVQVVRDDGRLSYAQRTFCVVAA